MDDKKKLSLNLNAREFVPKTNTNPNPNTNQNVGGNFNPNLNQNMNYGMYGNQFNPYMNQYNPYMNQYDPNMYGAFQQNQMNMQTQNTMTTNVKQGTGTTTNVNTQNKPNTQNTQQNQKGVQQQQKGGQQQKGTQQQGKTQNAPKKEEKKKEDKPKDQIDANKEKEINKIIEEVKSTTINDNAPQELLKDSKEGEMIEVDESKQPVNIVFIGHVDAGKSTTSGNILYLTGQVDERTIEKFQREAKANHLESWYMAYIMDVNEEERQRGKTVEVGKASFTTPSKRFTIMDAPGHVNYVPEMLQGACQADYAALVISAKIGEFEAGFEKDGRTREHALLAKSLGVSRLIVLINKMDDDTVKWSEQRYNQIKTDLSAYLKNCGYNLDKHVSWVPISALTGENLKDRASSHKCPWYKGPTFLDLLDQLDLPQRNENGPLRIPVLDRYKEQNVYVLGKIESGTIKVGGKYIVMPQKIPIEVTWLFNTEENGVPYAKPGENVRIKIKSENENDIQRGNIICSADNLCPAFNTFEAEIAFLELLENKPIIANGYSCIIHMHTIAEECTIEQIVCEIDRKTKVESKVKFLKNYSKARVVIKLNMVACAEKSDSGMNSISRFTLRDEGRTIAIGKILRYKKLGK